MRISAAILSFNSAPFLEKAVRSLCIDLGLSSEPDEVWVVENGSRDESPTILRRLEAQHPGVVKGIYLDRNQGTTAPRNMALRRSTGRYLIFMDSDVEVRKGTVDRLITVSQRNPSCGIIAPQLRYASGQVQLSADVFPTAVRKAQRILALRSLEREAVMPTTAQIVDYAISAFWLFSRDLLDRVGYLDERIFYSPEDVDYCIRVWQAGYFVCVDPAVAAIHHTQELSRNWRRLGFSVSHGRGLLYLFLKHRYFLTCRRLYRRIDRFGYRLSLPTPGD